MRPIFFTFFLGCLLLEIAPSRAQIHISRQTVIDSAIKNNPLILGAHENIQRQKALKKGSVLIDKTEFWMEAPTANRFALGVQQYINYPGVYINESKLQRQNIHLAEKELAVNSTALRKKVELLYLGLQYSHAKITLLKFQDSIYGRILRSAEKRYSAGDASYLEKVLEETKYLEIRNLMMQERHEINSIEGQISLISGIKADSLQPDSLSMMKADFPGDTSEVRRNPLAGYYLTNISISRQAFKVQRSSFFPALFLGYLNQGERGSDILYRFRFGVAVPLWFPSYTSRIKGARIGINVAEFQYKATLNDLQSQYVKAMEDLRKNRLNLDYYQQTALKQSDEILRSVTVLYNSGEISYFVFLQGLSQAMNIRMTYLEALRNYNISVIEAKYILGE